MSRWRWAIIALIFAGTVINYIDRQALSVLAPALMAELHFSNSQYATISSCFLLAYACSMWIWGAAFDRLGNRLGYGLAVTVWSLSEMGHAWIRGVGSFSLARAFLGAGESGNWPGATRTIAAWFAPRQRALAMGLANFGAAAGPMVAAPLIVWLQFALGWRRVFFVTGVFGFLWLGSWLALYPRPTGPRAEPEHPTVPWSTLFRRRQFWGIVLARFLGDPIWWLYLLWLPLYLAKARGFSLTQIGQFAWIPYVAAGVGALSGGWLSGFLIDRGWSVNAARKSALCAGTVLMLAGFPAAFAQSAFAALGFVCLTLFGFQFWVGNVQTLPSDFFSVGAVGSIAGFSGTAAGLGSVILTKSTGWVVDHFSYTPILVTAALLAPAATTGLFLLAGPIRRLHDFECSTVE